MKGSKNKGPSLLLFENDLWLLCRMALTLNPRNRRTLRVTALAHAWLLY